MIAQQDMSGRFARMRDRLAQALLREPSVILLERDADTFLLSRKSADGPPDRHDAIA